MKFSIVIPVLDEAAHLEDCLQAISRLRYPADEFEVIVVDNGSSDGSIDIATGRSGVRLLHESKNDAYLARNRGIEAAQGCFVAFTDGDCLVDPNWLARLEGSFEGRGADVVIGRLAYPEGASGFLTYYSQYYDAKTKWLFRETREACYYGHGGNMAVRKELFDRVGLFKTTPIVGDTEILHRLLESDVPVSIQYDPDAIVTHEEVRTFKEMLPKLRNYGHFSEAVSEVSGFRPLSLGERIRSMKYCVQENGYGPLRCIGLVAVLVIGLLNFECGRLRVKDAGAKSSLT